MRLALDVDTTELPTDDSTRLTKAILAVRRDLRSTRRSRPSPDRFEYQLTFETDSGEREDYAVCETDVPESALPLIEQLTKMARQHRA